MQSCYLDWINLLAEAKMLKCHFKICGQHQIWANDVEGCNNLQEATINLKKDDAHYNLNRCGSGLFEE